MNKSLFFGILFLGSVWGILEATMGNILHWIGFFPGTGMVMTSIGIGIMSFARAFYRKAGLGIALGAIAAAFKALDFLVPGSNVLRPMAAIILTALAFEAVTTLADRWRETVPRNLLTGAAAGYVSIAAFAFFTAYVMRFDYWLGKGFAGIIRYLLYEEWTFALGGLIMLTLGSYLASRFRIPLRKTVALRQFHYAAGAVAVGLFIIAAVV